MSSGHRGWIHLALIACGLVMAEPALAQGNQQWLTDVFGDTSSRARPATRKRVETTDRTSATQVLVSRDTLAGIERAIPRYERIVSGGGWRPIPGKRTLRPGSSEGARIAALRRRLMATGDLGARSRLRAGYDRELEEAVRAYQRRIGLTPTGIANGRTLAMLNVPATRRLQQLRYNRDRLRELLQKTAVDRYVIVNIPAYELQAVDQGRVAIYSRVIVGKPTTPTPVITAKIRALNLLPYWHVPQSIARRALIPHVIKDPYYLQREHIRVLSSWGGEEIDPRTVNWWSPQGQRYVFRQDPGPFNALGLIRLDMPNREIVYMHDTPLKRLFDFALRPYSAGCVRVQGVFDLAAWLIAPSGLKRADLDRMIAQGQRETLKLAQPVPVIFTYVTAWVTRDGTTHFRADIYDKDQEGTDVAVSAPWDKADVRVTP